ncbi:putative transmembrane protein, partial [Toxoplasma gondii RUB]
MVALRLFHPPRRRGAFSEICSPVCFLSLTRQRRQRDASLSLLSLRSSLSLRIPLSLSSFLSASSVSGCSLPSRSLPEFASRSAVSSAGCTYTQCIPSSRLQRRGASTASLRALHESAESARVRRVAAKPCGASVVCSLSSSSSSSPSRSRGLLSSPVVSGEKHPRCGVVWGKEATRTLRQASGGKIRLYRSEAEMTNSLLMHSTLPPLRDAIASSQASANEKRQVCTGCDSLSRALLFRPRHSSFSVLGGGPASRLFSSSKPPGTEDSTDSLPGVRTPSSSPDLPEEGSEPAGSAVIRRPEKDIRVGAGESLIEAMVEQSLKEAEEKALHARRHQGIELYPGGPVDRYGPPRDPSTLLLEPHKLTREERWFQIFFVAAPWIFFLCMLSAPILLAQYHVKKLGERASLARQVAEELMETSDADFFRLCTFQDLREIVEQPLHAFLCFLHPDTISSQVVAPLLRDVASLFKRLGIRASVALVDLSAGVPERMQSELPAALAPHGQLLLPFAFGGQQAAVVDFAETWTAAEIVKAVAAEVPGAQAAMAHTQ